MVEVELGQKLHLFPSTKFILPSLDSILSQFTPHHIIPTLYFYFFLFFFFLFSSSPPPPLLILILLLEVSQINPTQNSYLYCLWVYEEMLTLEISVSAIFLNLCPRFSRRSRLSFFTLLFPRIQKFAYVSHSVFNLLSFPLSL